MPKLTENELTRSIHNGTLIGRLNLKNLQDNPQELPEIIKLFKTHKPFKNDPSLFNINYGLDCIESSLNSIKEPGTEPELLSVFNQTLAETLSVLRCYLIKIQATLDYETFEIYCHQKNSDSNKKLLDQAPLFDYAKLDPFNPELQGRLLQLVTEHQYIALQKICGDGDCYFRAIMRSFIEQAILKNAEDRARLFNHLARLICDELLHNESFFIEDFGPNSEMAASMQALVTKLQKAAQSTSWKNLQEFRHDLVNSEDRGDDKMLIIAARYLTADCVRENLENNFNDISLLSSRANSLSPEIEKEVTLQNGKFDYIRYRKSLITKMGVCAEGAWVDTHLLPQMLNASDHLFIIPREKDRKLQELTPESLRDNFSERYQLKDVPENSIHLAFFPGHYDTLIPQDQYIAQQKHLLAVPYPANASPAPVTQVIETKEILANPSEIRTIKSELNAANADHYKAIITSFASLLDELNLQAQGLRDTILRQDAADAADELYTLLSIAQSSYLNLSDPGQFDPDKFREQCLDALATATPKLKGYQPIAQVLLDIINVILLPIALIVNTYKQNFEKWRFFTYVPREIKLINELETEIQKIEPIQLKKTE